MRLKNLIETLNFLKNKTRLILICLTLSSCAAAGVRTKSLGQKTEIRLAPRRLAIECELVGKDKYGFSAFVLDEKNTVTTFIQTNVLDHESCQLRLSRFKKIAQSGRELYIAGMGDVTEPIHTSPEWIDFPEVGKFHPNGRVIQFLYFANEHGQCFSAFHEDDGPCPRDGFPLKLAD